MIHRRFSFSFILLSVLCQSTAWLFGKLAALNATADIYSMYFSKYYILSLLCLALQAFFWIKALKVFPLSFAYPFMGLVYVINAIVGDQFFSENINGRDCVALGLIGIGIILMTRGTSND